MTVVHNLRHHNRSRILEWLAKNGSASRPEIAAAMNVSKVTITSIVNDLIADQWLLESAKTEGATGRPAGLVHLHPALGTVLAIDLQPTSIHVQSSNLLAETGTTKQYKTTKKLEQDVLKILQAEQKLASYGTLREVVVAVPAPIQPDGNLGQPSRLHHFDTQPILEWGSANKVAVSFENDVKLAAVAEFSEGAAIYQNDFALLSEREDGVALALYLGGTLYRGQTGRAGEIALLGWKQQKQIVPLEQLALATRELAVAQVCAALAVTLDLSLFLIQQSDSTVATLDVANHIREFVLRPIDVRSSQFGETGTLRGALIQAAKLAQHRLFSQE